jgi:hypothetical protein
MNDQQLIETLLYRGEGDSLDFKLEQYKFEGASDEEKSKLLKDILAFANSWREGPAHIIIGVRENPREVEGLDKDIDDAKLQQFINEKTNKPINLSYHSADFNGKKVGLFTIAVQDRPFYLKKAFGKLKSDVVYVRRGSSTAEAKPDEIAKMGVAQAIASTSAKLKLTIVSGDGRATPYEHIVFDYNYFVVDENSPLPDYELPPQPIVAGEWDQQLSNTEFYRELAKYLREQQGHFGFRIQVENAGNTYADDVRVQILALASRGFSLMEGFDFCPRPSPYLMGIPDHPNFAPPPFGNPKRPTFGYVKGHLVAEFSMGKLQAGETKVSDTLYLVCPPETLDKLSIKILSDHLSAPMEITVPVTVTSKDVWITARDLDESEASLPEMYEDG